jgi:hypothetical protein
MKFFRLVLFSIALPCFLSADAIRQTKGDHYYAFRQLDVDLPTPNVYRTASGAPGSQYWQQRADYKIEVSLDENLRRITGSETITYSNQSPDSLRYIWLQLDQNRFREDSTSRLTETASARENSDSLTYETLAREQNYDDLSHGHEILSVTDTNGKALSYTIVDTMMRIDLPSALKSGDSNTFSLSWAFNIIDNPRIGGRNGFEHFRDNDTYIYFLAQWFPRLVAYTDYAGWQHKQFLGRGEFTLEFGDYEVAISVPADHIVSATGELQNASKVLSAEQRKRMEEARKADKPIYIVTPEEALANEKEKSGETKTWNFKADNVRDFAWSSSRKFIWDAMIHKQEDAKQPEVLAMSFYPNEAMPIWSMYSTEAVVHTLDVYSRFSFNYPYPTAQSVNTWLTGGMEYPMITFNGYRPKPYKAKNEDAGKDKDQTDSSGDEPAKVTPEQTYSRNIKARLISVIVHEIGHTYFPMIVNSDERQWTWMDEGINSFLQRLAEFEWEDNFPQRGNRPILDSISNYMVSENQVPIMTNSEAILQFGPNAYVKPAAALIVLRETIMGRELFDHAFKEYSQRWMFKRPTPSDFFRTMEDASGIDLDWFWRGWFYSTDHVDVAINGMREYKISSLDPEVEFDLNREKYREDHPEPLTQIRNRDEGKPTRLERRPGLADFYNENDPFTITNKDRNKYTDTLKGLKDWEREALERAVKEDKFIYFVDFKNIGGLPTPLPLLITNADGSDEFLMIPAQIWRRDIKQVTKMLIRDQAVTSIELDPRHETVDADYSNNHFPSRIQRSRIELYKEADKDRDMMADMIEKLRGHKGGEDPNASEVPLEPANN